MRVIRARNVHEALPLGLQLLEQEGFSRGSRNGPVILAPWPVTTVYERPLERVVFWPDRDANPFFHLYEALWMLSGRNDVAGPARYAKNILNYSDDGISLHGAYGHRWRRYFALTALMPSNAPNGTPYERDQLKVIAETLRDNPEDRRCVLTMWHPVADLGRQGKDVPCNTIATFQRGVEGALDLTVFCRSNDIVWGAYGANAVHFSVLQEYMALWIGCTVGKMYQVSVNWHGYVEVLEKVKHIRPDRVGFIDNPYIDKRVRVVPMAGDGDVYRIDELIEAMLDDADDGFSCPEGPDEPWAATVYHVLKAHSEWKRLKNPAEGLLILEDAPIQDCDWVVAAREWLARRPVKV